MQARPRRIAHRGREALAAKPTPESSHREVESQVAVVHRVVLHGVVDVGDLGGEWMSEALEGTRWQKVEHTRSREDLPC